MKVIPWSHSSLKGSVKTGEKAYIEKKEYFSHLLTQSDVCAGIAQTGPIEFTYHYYGNEWHKIPLYVLYKLSNKKHQNLAFYPKKIMVTQG